jgi:hypothetical protein
MAKQFPVYKGLQKPLIYKGFQGKFIGWGVGSLLAGIIFGSIIGSFVGMQTGGAICVLIIVAGLFFTSQQQKKGLHSKTRKQGIFLLGNDFKRLRNEHAKQEI